MPARKIDQKKVVALLNEILEHEYAGVVRYTHYALNAYGFSRIPIVAWANENADESLAHARLAGEHVTNIGGHPSMKVGKLVDSGRHDVETMLKEAHAHESHAIDAYTELLRLVENRDVALEEYARGQVATETEDLKKIEKMLRKPGS